MVVKSIVFKREENSKWENGWYIGAEENSDKRGIYLDKDYQPIKTNNENNLLWDIKDSSKFYFNANLAEE